MIDPLKSPLLTDLYQVAMLEAYFEHGLQETAVFELFVRRLPPGRGFLLAAGLEQALQYLERLRVEGDDLEWLRTSGYVKPAFAERIASLRFTGDVHALPEGTPFFPDEPLIRIVAPLPEAQLVETRLMNILHFQTLVASKAARCVLAAPGKLLVEFGLRRAHGAEAGLFAARASYLAGFAGSSNVAAAAACGVPAFGTMAHAFVQAHDEEERAFERFVLTHPRRNTLLIDTYDTEEGARKVVRLAARVRDRGVTINAVRVDSGDLAAGAAAVRAILDAGGLHDTQIFCSGNLEETAVRDLLARGAPIDGFGIGTHLATSSDAAYLECAYKLMEYAGQPRRKRSAGKATLAGRKQVFRRYGGTGEMVEDVVTLESQAPGGEPLLVPVMRHGRRLHPPEPLDAIRIRSARELARLPPHLRRLDTSPPYPVAIAPALRELTESVTGPEGAGRTPADSRRSAKAGEP